jgi:DMSO/TMAO reductase YedYZ molybdopterin-dependent catalytic subunit
MNPSSADQRAIAKVTARAKSFQQDVFRSSLHDQRNAALLGSALGVTFTICFVTGLYSHFAQHPPSWFLLPSRPAGLYRVTQGVHVATGLATIPLLLAKLWTVYPKLFTWPPFSSIANAVERIAIFPLVAGALFLLFTGLANINLWYPWKFNFSIAHYWAAWTTIGALIVHIGAKWSITRQELRPQTAAPPSTTPAPKPQTEPGTLERRRFLSAVFATSALVTVFTIGQTVRPLRKLALLAPRRPDFGTQGFPVNRTARTAGVSHTALSPDYRLLVTGNVHRPLSLTLDDLHSLPQHTATLPIACVEGWSTTQRWTGIPVRDLLTMAGAPTNAAVHVASLQQARSYKSSELNHWQAHDPDTLLALQVNGETLALDHGYPLRLIGPDRPGVMQTKWVTKLVVR